MLACNSEILRIAQTAAAGGGMAAIGGAWREALLKALDSATRASYPQAWIFQGRCAHNEFELHHCCVLDRSEWPRKHSGFCKMVCHSKYELLIVFVTWCYGFLKR